MTILGQRAEILCGGVSQELPPCSLAVAVEDIAGYLAPHVRNPNLERMLGTVM